MNTRLLSIACLAALAAPAAVRPAVAANGTGRVPEAAVAGTATLDFEPNVGQAGAPARFVARARGYTALLGDGEAVLALGGGSQGELTFRWDGHADAVAENELPGRVNYLVGDDPALWRTGVATYASVRYEGVRPGVDLVFYGNGANLEYDFVVAPGADPRGLAMTVDGADAMRVDAGGDLVMTAGGAEVRQLRPVVYQAGAGGAREAVAAGYSVDGSGRVGFELGAFDPDRELVVDPTIVLSTFDGGGAADAGQGIAVDAAGSVYLVGATSGARPTTAGAYDVGYNGAVDAFVTKLDSAAATRVYSTYLGGGSEDRAYDVAVDAAGNAYVTGGTASLNFPTTPGSIDPTFNGSTDAFVTKIDPAGAALVYSTFLGNDDVERGDAIAIDAAGAAFVTGTTESAGFPVTAGAFDPSFNGVSDAFVTKLDAAGALVTFSTFLGGGGADSGEGIAVDFGGFVYVAGTTRGAGFPVLGGSFDATFNGQRDAFVTKLSPAGNARVYSTYLGGNNRDFATDIAVATTGAIAGQVYVTGYTRSPNFPAPGAPAGGYDAFVAALDAPGTGLVYAVFLGGAQDDGGRGIALDGNGSAHVTGGTASAAFPTTPGTIDASFNGAGDAFAAKLDAAGVLVFSTYLGTAADDSGSAVALYGGNIYVGGSTRGATFPTTAGVVQTAYGGAEDAFVTAIQP